MSVPNKFGSGNDDRFWQSLMACILAATDVQKVTNLEELNDIVIRSALMADAAVQERINRLPVSSRTSDQVSTVKQ